MKKGGSSDGFQINRYFLTDRKIQLRPQWVKKHIHFVHDKERALPEVEDRHQGVAHIRASNKRIAEPYTLTVLPIRARWQ